MISSDRERLDTVIELNQIQEKCILTFQSRTERIDGISFLSEISLYDSLSKLIDAVVHTLLRTDSLAEGVTAESMSVEAALAIMHGKASGLENILNSPYKELASELAMQLANVSDVLIASRIEAYLRMCLSGI